MVWAWASNGTLSKSLRSSIDGITVNILLLLNSKEYNLRHVITTIWHPSTRCWHSLIRTGYWKERSKWLSRRLTRASEKEETCYNYSQRLKISKVEISWIIREIKIRKTGKYQSRFFIGFWKD